MSEGNKTCQCKLRNCVQMVCCHISEMLPTVAYGNGELVSINIPTSPMPCDLHRFQFIITSALCFTMGKSP